MKPYPCVRCGRPAHYWRASEFVCGDYPKCGKPDHGRRDITDEDVDREAERARGDDEQ